MSASEDEHAGRGKSKITVVTPRAAAHLEYLAFTACEQSTILDDPNPEDGDSVRVPVDRLDGVVEPLADAEPDDHQYILAKKECTGRGAEGAEEEQMVTVRRIRDEITQASGARSATTSAAARSVYASSAPPPHPTTMKVDAVRGPLAKHKGHDTTTKKRNGNAVEAMVAALTSAASGSSPGGVTSSAAVAASIKQDLQNAKDATAGWAGDTLERDTAVRLACLLPARLLALLPQDLQAAVRAEESGGETAPPSAPPSKRGRGRPRFVHVNEYEGDDGHEVEEEEEEEEEEEVEEEEEEEKPARKPTAKTASDEDEDEDEVVAEEEDAAPRRYGEANKTALKASKAKAREAEATTATDDH